MLHDLTPARLAEWLVEVLDDYGLADRRDRRDFGELLAAASVLQKRIVDRVIGPAQPVHQWRLSLSDLMALCRASGADPARVSLAEFVSRFLPPAADVLPPFGNRHSPIGNAGPAADVAPGHDGADASFGSTLPPDQAADARVDASDAGDAGTPASSESSTGNSQLATGH